MDRPILFSTPMVRAILDGEKTMTRRIYKPRFDNWQVGDRLWVKETFALSIVGDYKQVHYRADNIPSATWKPSIFMRRSDSRILLEITELKREELFDISETDAIREGFKDRGTFFEYFYGLNKKIDDSFSNPEVLAIGFEVLEVKK